MTDSESRYKYYAFISYSHANKKWGDWLHKALESYRVPKHLVGKNTHDDVIPSRITPIFRDREELPTSSNLGELINQALQQSRYLIVICSPDSAKSHWVNEEILSFKRLGRSKQILAIIVDGEPYASDKKHIDAEECFPQALRYEIGNDQQLSNVRAEPIAADARPGKDGKSDANLKLIAGILGVGFNELKQRELQRRQKRLMAIAGAAISIATVTIALAITALIARNDAVTQRQEAERQRVFAEEAKDIAHQNLGAALFEKAHLLYKKRRYNEAAILAAEAWVKDPSKYYPGLFIDYTVLTPLKNILEADTEQGVSGIVVSDEYIYSSHYDNNLRKWDLASGELLKTFTGHSDRVRGIGLTHDKKRLISGGYDRKVIVWDVNAGTPVLTFEGHDHRVYTVDISPDEKTVASADNQGNILVWDINNGNILKRLLANPTISVMHIKFINDGNSLVTASHIDGDLINWSIHSDKSSRLYTNSSFGIWGFDVFNNQKNIVYTAGANKETINFIDADTGEKKLPQIRNEDAWFSDVALNQNNTMLLGSSRTGFINLFDLKRHDWVTSIFAHSKEARRSRFSNDGNYIISSGYDGAIRIWDISNFNNIIPFQSGDSRIEVMDMNKDKRLLAVGDMEGTVRIWNTDTGELFFKWQEADNTIINSLAFDVENRGIFIGGTEKLNFVNFDTKDIKKYTYKKSPANSHLIMSNDGKYIVRDSMNGRIEFYDLDKSEVSRVLDNDRTQSYALKFNREQTIVAAAGFGREIDLWDVSTGELIKTLKGHSDLIRDLDFGKDNLLVSGGGNGEVLLWDTSTGKPHKKLIGHAQIVFGVAFSPDGKRVATGGEDQKINIWDVNTGELLLTLYGAPEKISDIEYGTDNDVIFVSYFNGAVRKIDIKRAQEDPYTHLQRIKKLTGLKVDGFNIDILKKEEWDAMLP
jgi:WD40 repeat protein